MVRYFMGEIYKMAKRHSEQPSVGMLGQENGSGGRLLEVSVMLSRLSTMQFDICNLFAMHQPSCVFRDSPLEENLNIS